MRVLKDFVDERLVFREGNKYLGLALCESLYRRIEQDSPNEPSDVTDTKFLNQINRMPVNQVCGRPSPATPWGRWH
jgi:hypothetical protein